MPSGILENIHSHLKLDNNNVADKEQIPGSLALLGVLVVIALFVSCVYVSFRYLIR